ncbi:MAG: hypothetical protein DMG11_02800 [Acidobacteria bacterium]|nr:MAG: hypothetical protein DMG11_02800 [Acidobacteriota bacterium]
MRSSNFISKKIDADLSDPWQDGISLDDLAQERFRSLHVDREVVVDEEHSDLALFAFRAFFQQQHFLDDTLVCSEADGIAKESSDGAEVAAVWASPARFYGHHIEALPRVAHLSHNRPQPGRNVADEVELAQVDGVPGDARVIAERRLHLFALGIDRKIDLVEFATFCVGNDAWPRVIGFAEGDRVGVAWTAIPPERSLLRRESHRPSGMRGLPFSSWRRYPRAEYRFGSRSHSIPVRSSVERCRRSRTLCVPQALKTVGGTSTSAA